MVMDAFDKYLNPSIKRIISAMELIHDIYKHSTRRKICNISSITKRVTGVELWMSRVRIYLNCSPDSLLIRYGIISALIFNL